MGPTNNWKGDYQDGPNGITNLPVVVTSKDQPCQQLYETNVVLLGFDVVEYHFIPSYKDGGVAVRGQAEYAYNFEGYQFWFQNEKNRNRFIEDPWKYAPAWGGFCSWGIARERKPEWPWEIDFLGPPASPWEGWLITEDGKLIFNIWEEYSDLFSQDMQSNIAKAEERWMDLFGHLHAGPFNTHCIGHGSLKNWCLSQQPDPWNQPLPNCTQGIVTELDEFHEFSDESLLPWQKMIPIAGGTGTTFLVLIIVALVVFYRLWRRTTPLGKHEKEASTEEISETEDHEGGSSDLDTLAEL